MSNPLDSLLPPDYGKERPSSSPSKDPGGGRGGARDVWGNPRDPKREELKENSSEARSDAARFSTPQQRAGTVQGYKREAEAPKREYDQYEAPDSKRRHEGASTSQYSPRDGPPESFYAVSRIGVQLNSWGLDMSEMDKCIKKVLFEVTLVAGEKKYKLSDGIPMMKGDVNTQLKRLSSCKSPIHVWLLHTMRDTVYISASHITPNLEDQDVKLTKKDFTEQEWKIVNQISRRRDTEFEIRIRSIGEVYTRGDKALDEKNHPPHGKVLPFQHHASQLGGFTYFQDTRLHKLTRLDVKFRICLEGYLKADQRLPEQLVIYHIGSGEGDYEQIRGEVEEMREACLKFKAEYKPRFVVILVQRRSRIRVFPERIEGNNSKEQNVPSGTCVDTVGNAHGLDEFVLCCQTPLIGTVRPTKYTILVSYQPPAVPNVLYAAENLAKRGHNNYKTHRLA
ncbi:unnamed protein product [Caenorhabditis brenneri]